MNPRAAVLGALLVAATRLAAQQTRVDSLADRYWQAHLDRYPETATILLGPAGDRDSRLTDLRPAAFDAYEAALRGVARDAAMVDAASLSPRDRTTLATLQSALTGDLATRICRMELWSLDPTDGPQVVLPELASAQPVASAEERGRALTRWRSIGDELDQRVLDLRAGLAAGYAAPRGAVQRVLTELDALLAIPADSSPLLPPAARPSAPHRDDRWGGKMRAEVADVILPSLRRYRAFLREVYLPRARDWPGVDRNPDGAACYRARIYAVTSLGLGADSIHSLGLAEVAAVRRGMDSLMVREGGQVSLDSLINSRRGERAAIAGSTYTVISDPATVAQLADVAQVGHELRLVDEGWPLYVTRMVAEDSAHRTPVERFDALLVASASVSGLVIDTGIHALGWTRDSAVTYLLENSALTREGAEERVDWYAAHPGQALAAGLGADVIRALGREAADRLGAGFNLQAFSRAILANRGTPLAVLRDNIEAWIVAKGR